MVVIFSTTSYAYELLTVRISSQEELLFEKLARLDGLGHHYMFRPYSRKEILAVSKSLEGLDDKFTRSIAERLVRNLDVEDFYLFRLNPFSFSAIYGKFSDESSLIGLEFQQYLLFGKFFAIQAAEKFEASLDDETEGEWADVDFSELLASVGIWNMSLLAGRGGLWWGQGRWGTLLLSNNAGALDHIRLETNSPIRFGALGSLKFGFMLAKLEKEREIPEPMLFAIGASWKAWNIELGALRTIMFGGKNRPVPNSLSDYSNLFFATNEHTEGKGLDTNQLLMVCGRLSIPEVRELISDWMYFGFYFEYGAEGEMNGTPSSIAHVWGVEFDFGRTDIRVEVAETENPSPWYEHYVYKDGYTYKGKIIGHHIGCCSHGGFAELNQYVFEPFILRFFGGATRYERKNIVKTDMSHGIGLLVEYKSVNFAVDFSMGQASERLESGEREDKLYGKLGARLEISIP